MRNRKHDGNKSSGVNFGVQGWVTILYCLLMFWLYAGMVNSGSNVTAPAIAEKFGILPGTVLNMNTVAGVVGVIFFIVVGQINRVIGARITSGVCLIVAGLAYLGVGNAVNLAMYTVCMCIVVGGVMSAGYISGGDLVTQWFPKKKGIVMGYTTMGHNLASVAFVPLITLLVGRLGIGNGVIPISVCAIVLGILGLLLVRNTPQERGLNPDNVSDEVYRTEYFHGHEDPTGGWTTGRLLRCKETWLVAVTTGMFQICSLGVVSQMVLRNMELGFSREQATFILSLVALIGLVGSFFVGYMDERLGTKKSMLFFGIQRHREHRSGLCLHLYDRHVHRRLRQLHHLPYHLRVWPSGIQQGKFRRFPHPRRCVRPLLRGQRRSLQHHRRQPALHLSHFCRRIRSLRAHCTASG